MHELDPVLSISVGRSGSRVSQWWQRLTDPDQNLFGYLRRHLPTDLEFATVDPQWAERVLAQYPAVGAFLVSGLSAHLKIVPKADGTSGSVDYGVRPARLDILSEAMDQSESGRTLGAPIEQMLAELGQAVALICAAGGSLKIVDLLRAWVEERKGRKIRIKRGDLELEIWGGMSEDQVKRIMQVFDEYVNRSNIIKP